MHTAVTRIVVQVSPQEKRVIAAKARRLGVTVSELMRRGAQSYSPIDADLLALAEAAQASAARSMAAMDEAIAFVAASEARISSLEKA